MPNDTLGFTLIEVIVVIVIIGTLFIGLVGLSSGVMGNSQLTVESDRVVEVLRRAQSRSVNGYFDDKWSVHVETDEITLYKGDDFGARDTSFDEINGLHGSVDASGLADVTFEEIVGGANNTGTITLTSSVNGNSVDVVINEAGQVTKQ